MVAAGQFAKETTAENLDLVIDPTAWPLDPERVNLRREEPYPLYTYPHHVTGQPVTVRMPLGEYQIRTTQFRAKGDPNTRLVAGYFFIANGEITPFPEKVRLFAFDLTTKHAYFAKVQFSMFVRGEVDLDRYVEQVSDLLESFLPELMQCLPDWSEVESQSPGASPV